MNTLVLLAGGSSARMGEAVPDKTLAPLAGQPVITHSARAFQESGLIAHYLVVYRDAEQRSSIETALEALELDAQWVQGGATRQESVSNALYAIKDNTSHVFIHDAARPLIRPQAIHLLNEALSESSAAVLAHPVTDTIKRVPAGGDTKKVLLEDLDRSRLWAMETPQAFALSVIREAHKKAHEAGLNFTDDAAIASHSGTEISLVRNPHPNPKLTESTDLKGFERMIEAE
ncbi:MAG: 2-C-methyl-D-erythritol 4-phosphate cytidylyltransferase [Verrucomicrobia bacterium]|nr:2-C-methyl-D-erythritol 4-phosphate cytidylyltransferase [Verrucomicrobiota bacterium]